MKIFLCQRCEGKTSSNYLLCKHHSHEWNMPRDYESCDRPFLAVLSIADSTFPDRKHISLLFYLFTLVFSFLLHITDICEAAGSVRMIKLTTSEPHILFLKRKQFAGTAYKKLKHEGSLVNMAKTLSGKQWGQALSFAVWNCPWQGLSEECTWGDVLMPSQSLVRCHMWHGKAVELFNNIGTSAALSVVRITTSPKHKTSSSLKKEELWGTSWNNLRIWYVYTVENITKPN